MLDNDTNLTPSQLDEFEGIADSIDKAIAEFSNFYKTNRHLMGDETDFAFERLETQFNRAKNELWSVISNLY